MLSGPLSQTTIIGLELALLMRTGSWQPGFKEIYVEGNVHAGIFMNGMGWIVHTIRFVIES